MEKAIIGDSAKRMGSFALFVFAFVSLCSGVVLPFIVQAQSTESLERIRARSGRLSKLEHISLSHAWLASQILFALCMFSTVFTTNTTSATILVGIVGVSWSCTIWIPWALVNAAILRQSAFQSFIGPDDDTPRPGTVLALHNVAIAAPQMVAAVLSSILFAVMRDNEKNAAWLLCVGGVFGLVAAWATRRIEQAR